MKSIDQNPKIPIIATHYEQPQKLEGMKRWIIAGSRMNWLSQKRQNAALEAAYHRTVDHVKTHCLKPGDLYFERDYKNDSSEGYLAMHCFLTPTFYIYLECTLSYDYNVEYCLNFSKRTPQLLNLLNVYAMRKASLQIKLKPDFETFYNRTLEMQDARFTHSFKG